MKSPRPQEAWPRNGQVVLSWRARRQSYRNVNEGGHCLGGL